MGAELYPRIHNRPGGQTTPDTPSSRIEVFTVGDRESYGRGSQNDSQTSGVTGTTRTIQQGIPIPTILSPKEGRRHETHYQPEGSEYLCRDSPLQDGGYPYVKGHPKPGDWMTKVDLKDAYFMIPMASHHKRLLRFPWQGQTYKFNCLPFGLSSAPWVFTKTTRLVVAMLRSLGLRFIIYIDDILLLVTSPTVAREHTAGLIFLLENLGFIINHPKSHLTPTQEMSFLGLVVNSHSMEIRLSGDKIKQICQDTRKVLETPHPQAVILSRLLGKLNHAAQAIPPAPLFYRNLQVCLQNALERTVGGRDYTAHTQHLHQSKNCSGGRNTSPDGMVFISCQGNRT